MICTVEIKVNKSKMFVDKGFMCQWGAFKSVIVKG